MLCSGGNFKYIVSVLVLLKHNGMSSIKASYHSIVTNFSVDETSLHKARIIRTNVEGRCNNILFAPKPLIPMCLCF